MGDDGAATVVRRGDGLGWEQGIPVTREDPVSLPTGFADAASRVLAMLNAIAPMGLWMVTRTVGDDWIVLQSVSPGYDVAAGDVFRWSDSFCSRMVAGEGPRVAPDSDDVPSYRDAPLGRQIPIRSYAGVELVTGEGELFGTLCAIDPEPQHLQPEALEHLLTAASGLLSRILTTELALQETRRAFVRVASEAETDQLTGLVNRRGWESSLRRLETVAAAVGTPMTVALLDLDGLKTVNDLQGHETGDELLRATARCLTSRTRRGDVVARLGGDEFGVLLPATTEPEAAELLRRLGDELAANGIRASIGAAERDETGLRLALGRADRAMYRDKQQRNRRRPRQPRRRVGPSGAGEVSL